MELHTDTMGCIMNPREKDITNVIKSSNQMPTGSLINLEKDINNYLSLSVGTRNGDHSITLKNKSLKVVCAMKFNNNEAIKLFNSYLNEDLSWYEKYQWNQTIVNQILGNIDVIQSMDSKDYS